MERIRPCLKCGGMIPFAALACHLCGAPVEGAAREGERVRACLSCGVIVSFDQDPCPQCGAAARPPAEHADRVKECMSCGALTAFQNLYCEHCGDLSIDWEEDEIPPVVKVDPRAALAGVPEIGAGAVLVVGISALVLAAVRILL